MESLFEVNAAEWWE